MNKEQIIDEVYENFIDKTKGLNLNLEINKDIIVVEGPIYHATPRLLSQEEFINKCKTDPEFSEKWGLKIEERELSLEEREDLKLKLILEHLNKKGIITSSFEDFKKDENIIPNIDWRREVCGLIGWIDYGNEVKRNRLEEIYDDVKNIPTKQITLEYNNEKTYYYE
jgi:hypothetical protein